MPLFFYGDDTFSLQHELKKIKEQFSFKHGPAGIEQCQLDEGDSDGETLSRLRQLFETQGLFAQKKLIIIKDFLSVSDSLPKSQEYLLDLFEKAKLVDEIVLVQILPFDRRRKIFKALVKLTQA
ncbi:MAG: hypothetical protein Q8R08_04030, partial [bacterium]|nr:hypothetical protein [bacterium]